MTKNEANRQAKLKQNSGLASKPASKTQANRKQKTNFASNHVYFGLPIVNRSRVDSNIAATKTANWRR
jgi:hypothetical protein